jgi:hypothetical protein
MLGQLRHDEALDLFKNQRLLFVVFESETEIMSIYIDSHKMTDALYAQIPAGARLLTEDPRAGAAPNELDRNVKICEATDTSNGKIVLFINE